MGSTIHTIVVNILTNWSVLFMASLEAYMIKKSVLPSVVNLFTWCGKLPLFNVKIIIFKVALNLFWKILRSKSAWKINIIYFFYLTNIFQWYGLMSQEKEDKFSTNLFSQNLTINVICNIHNWCKFGVVEFVDLMSNVHVISHRGSHLNAWLTNTVCGWV